MNSPAAAVSGDTLDSLNLFALRALYRYTALALADPQTGAWEQLVDPRTRHLVAAAAALLQDDPAARPAAAGWGEHPLSDLDPREVFASLPGTAEAWNACYEKQFGLLVSGGCPPYETEYIDSKLSFQRAQAMADIAGFYRAFGWTPSCTHPERPDHVSLELEFMATLCGMQTRAEEEDSLDHDLRKSVCQDAQGKFLSEHLLWWVPAFAKLLSHNDPRGPYEAIGRFITALLPAHRALLNLPPHSGPSRPSCVEPPEECEGCMIHTGLTG